MFMPSSEFRIFGCLESRGLHGSFLPCKCLLASWGIIRVQGWPLGASPFLRVLFAGHTSVGLSFRAMASPASRDQFLRQMEQIVEGIKQSRMKVRWFPFCNAARVSYWWWRRPWGKQASSVCPGNVLSILKTHLQCLCKGSWHSTVRDSFLSSLRAF